MEDQYLLEYQLALRGYLAKAEKLGLSVVEADQILARVIAQGYASATGVEEIEEASRRLSRSATRVDHPPLYNQPEVDEMTAQYPQPGDIVLLKIKGWVGLMVWTMQALNGDISRWTHAGIMLDDGTFFEAQPGGSVITDWIEYTDRPHAKVRARVASTGLVEPMELSGDQRVEVIEEARQHLGIGYNWATYLYLAAYRLRIRPQWLKARVQRSDKLICSQAVDEIYGNIGIQLFDDGRMPYDITPGDLARLT